MAAGIVSPLGSVEGPLGRSERALSENKTEFAKVAMQVRMSSGVMCPMVLSGKQDGTVVESHVLRDTAPPGVCAAAGIETKKKAPKRRPVNLFIIF